MFEVYARGLSFLVCESIRSRCIFQIYNYSILRLHERKISRSAMISETRQEQEEQHDFRPIRITQKLPE